MTRERIVFIILTLAVLGVLFLRPDAGWKIAGFLGGVPATPDTADALQIENAGLKNELAFLTSIRNGLPEHLGAYIAAPVYARYPFNLKDELTVAVGDGSHVSEGDAVFLHSSSAAESASRIMLIGRVEKVVSPVAVVQTIFDSRWRSAVRIGGTGSEALLVGGLEPRLTLIAKDANIVSGDAVFSSDRTLPMGGGIGSVRALSTASDTLLQEATLHIPYDIKKINVVLINVGNK